MNNEREIICIADGRSCVTVNKKQKLNHACKVTVSVLHLPTYYLSFIIESLRFSNSSVVRAS